MNLDDMPPTLAFGAEIGAMYALVIGDDPNWAGMRDNFARFCTGPKLAKLPQGVTSS